MKQVGQKESGDGQIKWAKLNYSRKWSDVAWKQGFLAADETDDPSGLIYAGKMA